MGALQMRNLAGASSCVLSALLMCTASLRAFEQSTMRPIADVASNTKVFITERAIKRSSTPRQPISEADLDYLMS
jgi:hypothetical protein